LEATEIYAYPRGTLPGTYARNSPDNPDAVISYSYTTPQPTVYASRQDTSTGNVYPNYSFDLMLKRTDNATVVATINGKKYESGVAWDALKACAAH
jgi:hypothetical protein